MKNIPEMIYKYTDKVLSPIVNTLISKDDIAKRLEFEISIFDLKSNIDYSMEMVSVIHDRASSMVSHLSIMLAMCLFLLDSGKIKIDSFEYWMVMIDTFVYILLVIFSVRCLRSFGLDMDYADKDQYETHMFRELTYKYCLMQIINSMTILATVVLVGALIISLSS